MVGIQPLWTGETRGKVRILATPIEEKSPQGASPESTKRPGMNLPGSRLGEINASHGFPRQTNPPPRPFQFVRHPQDFLQSFQAMKIHWFQHVPFEGLGALEGWLLARGHALTCTRFHAGDAPPQSPDGFDWLIVMGGPMNVYQYRDHPWLPAEKRMICETIAAGKRVLGICLGAQLIADALGGKVYQNDEREIGWFSIRAVAEGSGSAFGFPRETLAFHWHGDTFSLPPGSTWLAESAGCAHQAFAIGSQVLGLQFHLEMSPADIGRIVQACSDDLAPGRYVRSAQELVARAPEGRAAAALLDRLLTVLEQG
jgi:GMP synthase-like glutamine amidotransferase